MCNSWHFSESFAKIRYCPVILGTYQIYTALYMYVCIVAFCLSQSSMFRFLPFVLLLHFPFKFCNSSAFLECLAFLLHTHKYTNATESFFIGSFIYHSYCSVVVVVAFALVYFCCTTISLLTEMYILFVVVAVAVFITFDCFCRCNSIHSIVTVPFVFASIHTRLYSLNVVNEDTKIWERRALNFVRSFILIPCISIFSSSFDFFVSYSGQPYIFFFFI